MTEQITWGKEHVQRISNRAQFGSHCKINSTKHTSPWRGSFTMQSLRTLSESTADDQLLVLQRLPSGEEQRALLGPEHFRENGGKWVGVMSTLSGWRVYTASFVWATCLSQGHSLTQLKERDGEVWAREVSHSPREGFLGLFWMCCWGRCFSGHLSVAL